MSLVALLVKMFFKLVIFALLKRPRYRILLAQSKKPCFPRAGGRFYGVVSMGFFTFRGMKSNAQFIFVSLFLWGICAHGQFDRGQGQPLDKGLAFGQWDGPVADLFTNIRTNPNALNGALANVKGSPYFEERYLSGTLFKGDEPLEAAKYFRYNAYLDEIELSNLSNPPAASDQVLLKLEYISCEIDGVRYVVRDYYDAQKQLTQKGFFIPLHQSEQLEVVQQNTMEFRDARPAKTSLEIPIPARFIPKTRFYIRYQGGALEPLKPTKRELGKYLKRFGLTPKTWAKAERGATETDQLRIWLAHLN
jgi:hypothetical protein